MILDQLKDRFDMSFDTIDAVAKGGNNCIHKGITKSGKCYAIKEYSSYAAIKNERLNREFNALSFLINNNVDCVPAAIHCDLDNNVGIYQWVEGEKIEEISKSHVGCLIDFLKQLKQLSLVLSAKELDGAKDACINAENLLSLIESRFKRLDAVSNEHVEVKNFIKNECRQVYSKLEAQLRTLYNDNDLEINVVLDQRFQTLSPTDYGFHNALCTKEGKLFFIDFEYFGWDDPVKMVSDFLWHPGMVLDESLRQYFQYEMDELFADDEYYKIRFEAQFPLYGLIWVLILLNQFIPAIWSARAKQSIHSHEEKTAVLERQFTKARKYLEKLTYMQNTRSGACVG